MLAALCLLLSSCNDFLDKVPSKSANTPVETSGHLLAIYDYFYNRYKQNYFAMYSTDDTDIPKQAYASAPAYFNINDVVSNYTHYRDGIIANSTDGLWQHAYDRIYKANLIISSASSVTGSQEDISRALSCAYFMRAYCFFELATFYCQPWSEDNKDELGIPLRKGLDYEENISRGTLQQTYDQIFSDLEDAEKNVVDEAVPTMAWRVSRCAINALYARIYLARGEFETALQYANKALENAPALYDYNQFKKDESPNYWSSIQLNYCETNSWSDNKLIYNYPEWIYIDFAYCPTQLCIPSHELVALYDRANDLRFKWQYIVHGIIGRFTAIDYDYYRYVQYQDGMYMNSGLTTAEVMLIKAECQARTGDWSNALSTLTPLRTARFATGTATELTASSQAEALKKVLEERRRELPFYYRFGDIKRFAVTADTSDDVTVVRDFYEQTATSVDTSAPKTYTIPGSSRCWAMPIYQTEINASNGVIEQNPE